MVEWERKLQAVRRIKINVQTILGHFPLRGRKMMYLDYDRLIVLLLLLLVLVVIVVVVVTGR
jgi:hypothetical protein